MTSHSLTRRRLIALAAGTALATVAPLSGHAAETGLRLILLADLHSAYERLPQLLAAIDANIAAASGAPTLILINGDIFEAGNVVASRSKGRIDWAFVKALTERGPVVLNLGNHEPDLVDDLAQCVRHARELGVRVVSNIIDTRTDRPFADASAEVLVGGTKVRVIGIATNAINTYPKAQRPNFNIPNPVAWARDMLPGLMRDDAVNVVLSHAGVAPDREILPLLPDGTLIVGGHDHLQFVHERGRTRYVHGGSWSRSLTGATIRSSGIALTSLEIGLDAPRDAALSAIVAEEMERHLTDAEKAVVGKSPKALGLDDSGREVARIIAAAHGADVGLVGHTTFGTGFPAGDVTRYAFDAVVRFDGKLMTAEVGAAELEAIYDRANQDGDIPLARRLGDYLYANPVDVEAGKTYRIVTNDWTVTNAQAYLGRSDIAFRPVPDAMLKPTVLAALKG